MVNQEHSTKHRSSYHPNDNMKSSSSVFTDIGENDRRAAKLECSDDDGSDDDLIVSNPHAANRSHDASENKVSIIVPRVAKQLPSLGDRIIGFIMSGGRDFHSGLTGQPLLYFTSVFVSLGVFLFGYDQGVMSGIITSEYFIKFFDNPSRFEIGSMVAILEIGALISSLLVGRLGDAIGRRKTILYGAIIFVAGGAAQSFTTGLISMIIGRTISGFGVGMLSTIVPVYQSEISPPHNRGKLACIEFTGNIVGYASSVWVDYFCSFIKSDASWRLPLFLQCVMGALLFAGSFIIVETPRWLLDNDHDREGLLVLGNLHGGGDVNHPEAQQEFRDIKESVLLERLEGERTYRHMWKRYKKRVLIAMSSQAFAQLNGINVISYYAPLVFEEAGWTGRNAILMTGINGLIYIVSTIPPWYLADRWGRRIILLSGAVIMAVALSCISISMYIEIPATPNLVVIFVIIFNAAFGYSWGPIPWLYPPEILPLPVRAKGASLSTASNWAFNFIVGEMTPVLQEVITWRLYLVHAFFCACSFVCVYFFYPETMGIHLEDMNQLFGDYVAHPSGSMHSAMALSAGAGLGLGAPSIPMRQINRGENYQQLATDAAAYDVSDAFGLDQDRQDGPSFGRLSSSSFEHEKPDDLEDLELGDKPLLGKR
jgi:sugar porter (SP) family MFS transporter